MTLIASTPRRGLDADRLFLALCFGVPLAVLLVFFVYPLATVFIRSFTVSGANAHC